MFGDAGWRLRLRENASLEISIGALVLPAANQCYHAPHGVSGSLWWAEDACGDKELPSSEYGSVNVQFRVVL